MDLSIFCQSNLLYTQESLSRYQPGGYHPYGLRRTESQFIPDWLCSFLANLTPVAINGSR
ncbi:hypothetical protein N7492_007103 [Penicillium capsulatum]|uniref:Uncharacterized protein n=1 Tax=Penicillium capsulatum TaxID=69766 RepID=A0A9W9I1C4_9EURO|nr:hypothetical protein N7492_007103 [Penicillium capsulatum]KAJ6116940.1 hypothetical protein N7512_006665 [Penicillium capsulatum]